jgi:hypothetical protein
LGIGGRLSLVWVLCPLDAARAGSFPAGSRLGPDHDIGDVGDALAELLLEL